MYTYDELTNVSVEEDESNAADIQDNSRVHPVYVSVSLGPFGSLVVEDDCHVKHLAAGYRHHL